MIWWNKVDFGGRCCHYVCNSQIKAIVHIGTGSADWYKWTSSTCCLTWKNTTAWCKAVQSASTAITCRLSLTLVDQDHIGSKSWKLIARTISPTPSLFVAQRPSPNPRGNMRKFGETRGGVGKSGVLEHKSGNISETRKDRVKVAM